MREQNPVEYLKHSIQRALMDEVTENLCAVTCGIEDKLIKIVAYFKGLVSEEDIERIQAVSAEVISDFPEDYMIEESCLSIAQHSPQMLDFWAYKTSDC